MKLVNIDTGWINISAVSAITPSSTGDFKTNIYLIGDNTPMRSYLPLDEVVAIINGGLK
ncbi:hypothetical protein ACXM1Q_000250 [Streptococcus sp. 10F2]